MNASQRPTVLVDFTSIHVLDIDGLVEAKKSSSLMSIHVSYEHNYDIRVGYDIAALHVYQECVLVPCS